MSLFGEMWQRLVYWWKPSTGVHLPEGTSLLKIPGLAPPGFTAGIELLNDSATPMQFVVDALMAHVGLSRTAAIRVMLTAHSKGGVVVSIPPRDSADRAATAIVADAQSRGYALTCRAVSV